MPAWVEMVRGVIAIVEAMAIRLDVRLLAREIRSSPGTSGNLKEDRRTSMWPFKASLASRRLSSKNHCQPLLRTRIFKEE